MSPVAVGVRSGASPSLKADIPRRPSPWHEIAHSLSETVLPSATRRYSTPGSAGGAAATPPLSMTTGSDPLPSDTIETHTSPSPALSSSALREWERLLSSSADVKRHQLVHPSTSPHLHHATSRSSLATTGHGHSPGPPKLAAERDKDGHIEYKLKLIDPTPERFDKLVTQMLWRLKQGRNEAIYELGLADDGTVIGLTRAEMDASLRTLELMASEVGATVIVLREVVLVGGPSLPPGARLTPALSPSLSSSEISGSSVSGPSQASQDGAGTTQWSWPVTRPDLDKTGQPRVNLSGGKKWRSKIRRDRRAAERERIRGGLVSEDADGVAVERDEEADVDVPPFHLDLDEPPRSPIEPAPPQSAKAALYRSWADQSHTNGLGDDIEGENGGWRNDKNRRQRRLDSQARQQDPSLSGDPFSALPFPPLPAHRRRKPRGDPDAVEPMSKRQSQKAVKAAVRREQRRLDLYRGDGTGELWLDMEGAEVAKGDASMNANGGDVLASGAEMRSGTRADHGERWPEGVHGEIEAVDDGGASGSPGAMVDMRKRKVSSGTLAGVAAGQIVHGTGTPPACVPSFSHPYQPARPSSLRLATPAPALTSTTPSSKLIGADDDEQTDENDPFLAELLLLPLDNLSLSFAEVRTVTDPYVLYEREREHGDDCRRRSGSGSSTDSGGSEVEVDETTAYAPSPPLSPRAAAVATSTTTAAVGAAGNLIDQGSGTKFESDALATATAAPPLSGPELICVEALVVRKTAEGVAGVEDWCEGGEDAWGFGYGYGGEGEGEGEADVDAEADERGAMLGPAHGQEGYDEVDADDPWGF